MSFLDTQKSWLVPLKAICLIHHNHAGRKNFLISQEFCKISNVIFQSHSNLKTQISQPYIKIGTTTGSNSWLSIDKNTDQLGLQWTYNQNSFKKKKKKKKKTHTHKNSAKSINFVIHPRNLKGEIGPLFDPCVNAMGRRTYWPSPMVVSYCTYTVKLLM